MVDECVSRWLSGLAESTRESRLPLLMNFFDFVGLEPTAAVEIQRLHPNDYRFVDLAYEWVESGNLRVSTMVNRVSMVRGFFLANRAPLPRDRHRFHSDRAPVFCELSVEELRKILVSCNLMYRAAYLVGFQSGSGIGEILYINEHHADYVWDEVRKGRKVIRLTMPGRKKNRNVRPYYTFIGADAIDALKHLFHSRGWKRDTVLFRNEYENPLTSDNLQSYFLRRAFKLGLVKRQTYPCLKCGGETVRIRRKKTGVSYTCTTCQSEHTAAEHMRARNIDHSTWGGIRYRINVHELRDLFRTEWHRAQRYFAADPTVGEFLMGHTIDPLKYDKIMRDVKDTLAEYKKAVPMFNILSEDPRVIDRSDIEVELESYRTENKELRRKLSQVSGRLETLEDQVEKRLDEIDKKAKQWTKSME